MTKPLWGSDGLTTLVNFIVAILTLVAIGVAVAAAAAADDAVAALAKGAATAGAGARSCTGERHGAAGVRRPLAANCASNVLGGRVPGARRLGLACVPVWWSEV